MYGVNSGYMSRRLAELNRIWQLTEFLRVSRESAPLAGCDEIQGEKHEPS